MVSLAPTKPRRANRTTVALKAAMAVSGIIFILYVLVHMYGNLKLFSGAEAYNGYAEALRDFGYPYLPHEGFLWILRLVLTASLVVHVAAAVTLWRRAREARHQRYLQHKRLVQTYSARTVRWGGIILFAFVVFHILQFTTLTINVGGTFDSPYERFVAAFQVWWLYLIYLLAIVLLTMHVRHGTWSALQTLGAADRRRTRAINLTAYLVAGALLVGFMLPPTAVLLGLVK